MATVFEQETNLRAPMQRIPLVWDEDAGEYKPAYTQHGIPGVKLVGIIGKVTDVNASGLTDTTKDFEADLLNSREIRVTHEGVDYYRTITDTDGSDIEFAVLIPEKAAVAATATIGAEPDGIISIAVKEAGADGNDYAVQLVDGVGDGENDPQPMSAAFADDVLTITSATDAEGEPVAMSAEDIVALINTDATVSLLFEASGTFTAGNIAAGEPIQFSGGADVVAAVVPAKGDAYEVLPE